MGLRINTNIAAMNAYRNLSMTQSQMSTSLERLSSGYRINKAADDAAGLAISEGLRSQIGGLKVAARNTQDGVNLVQTADGALNEVQSILQRLRDLGVQAANDTNNSSARDDITTEATSLVSELKRVGQSTNFDGIKLLDGTAGTLNFQVGADGDANSRIQVDLSNVDVTSIASTLATGNLAVAGTSFTMDATKLSELAGATLNFSETNGGTTTNVAVTLNATAPTSIQDVANQLSSNAGFSAAFNVSVNKDANGAATGITVTAKDGGSVATTDPDGTTAGTGDAFAAGVAGASSPVGLDFSSSDAAQASINMIDTAIQQVSTSRASLGAYQNRFQHTINNINVAVENLSASESAIRDTDMASEMVNFTRTQILSQAGTAMLAQANHIPDSVLKLLQ